MMAFTDSIKFCHLEVFNKNSWSHFDVKARRIDEMTARIFVKDLWGKIVRWHDRLCASIEWILFP